MYFAVAEEHKVKTKESEKINKYLDLARELKKLWNIKVVVISILVDLLGMVLKDFERILEELEIKGESRSARPQHRVLRRLLKTREDLLSLRLQ